MSHYLGNNEIKLSDDTMIVTETDEKGAIIFASKDFCKISGFEPQELLGKHHNVVRHQAMPRSAFEDLWKTVKSGKSWNGIVINKTKDNGFYWVNSTVYPSKRKDGSTKYISVRVKPSEQEVQNAIKLYLR